MKWEEYLKTDFKVGDKIWVCDYRFKDKGTSRLSKPIRHVKPIQVILCSNSDLPKNKRIYYSEYHLKGLNKKGKILKSKVIAPFDNTGHRYYTGISINVFECEEECRDFYKDRCIEILEELKQQVEEFNLSYHKSMKELNIEIGDKK